MVLRIEYGLMKLAVMKPRLFIYAALGADLAIAITKFVAGALTGSSAMISEGIHSIIDSGNQVLLLIGIKSSTKKADEKRPFGWAWRLYLRRLQRG